MEPLEFYEYLISKGFERRRSQEEMIKLVDAVLERGGVKLIEAPTGTGKTFAYLIPVITRGSRAVISTLPELRNTSGPAQERDLEFLTVTRY
ncbi:MAG: DEAD/DEAH box helicase [Aquificota bacterium]|nr:DEAD/DEAH box helicase [Aquificota bacterium]